jgi:hypothetical protein
MKIEGLVRVKSLSKLAFKNVELDFEWAEKNANYDDIKIAKEYLKRAANNLKDLAKEIEKIIQKSEG